MKKLVAFLALAAVTSVSAANFKDGKGMFDRRLGMFIHWGIYSVGEWHCQELWRKRLARVDYEKYKDRFRAEKFDADRFVDVAELAGATYIVITTKHHDGFCMWDTKTTDYNVMNTPARRDIIKEVADACHRRGMGIGFYFSNPDWHAPFANNPKSTHQLPLQPGDAPDEEKYIAYVKAQVTELCSNYGSLCCFFWDIPPRIDRPEMDELVRGLQPGILIDDRGWGNKATCDYSTPERDYKWDQPVDKNVECCDAVGVQSWGYRRNEDYHTHGYLTRKIDAYLSTGANFLLNVGPKSDGTIPDESLAIMAKVGSWHARVGDAFRNVRTVPGLVDPKCNAVVTRRGDTLFIHFPKGLEATGLNLAPLDVLPEKATLLNSGMELKTEIELFPWSCPKSDKRTLHVWGVPADEYANECMVMRLDFKPGVLPEYAQTNPQPKRTLVQLNDGWEVWSEEGSGRSEERWVTVDLPHDATENLPRTHMPDHAEQGFVKGGIFRYRKVLPTPKVEKGTRLSVRFDGVYMNSSVTVNGRHAGGRHNGYVPFEVALDASSATNLIEVTVDATTPNTRWNPGAGMLRNVWLVRRRGYTLEPENVAIRVVSANEEKAVLSIRADDGAEIVEPANGRLVIERPRLWCPDDPYRYEVRVVARNREGETDAVTIPYGIRTIEFTKDDGFKLNGKRLQIKGVCQHEGSPCFGALLNEAGLEYGIREMKKLGANAIRTAHNPFPPEFLELCDKHGMLVKNELFDEWRVPKKMKFGYARFFDSDWKDDLETIVRRDRNRASVIIWSIGNEIRELAGMCTNTGGVAAFTREMREAVRMLDPTRPVSAGLHKPKVAAAIGVCDELDVVGINYNGDCFDRFRGRWPLFGSETAATYSLRDVYHYEDDGSDTLKIVASRDHLGGGYSSVPWWGGPDQDQERTLKRQMECPWSAGEFAWCSFDYLGEGSNGDGREDFWPCVASQWGMYDFAGLPKDKAYLYQSVWSATPMVHVFPDWTFGKEAMGKKVPVWCYTNCEAAELFLNGVSQGTRRKTDTAKLHLEWLVPYAPGVLEVRGMRNGAVIATDAKQTAGEVARVVSSVLFESGDTVMIRFDAVDGNGVRVVGCNEPVKLEIAGGELLAAANGDPTDSTPRRNVRRRLFRGSMAGFFRRGDGFKCEVEISPIASLTKK